MMDRDNKRVTQNSGVNVVFQCMYYANVKDNNSKLAYMTYYGVIKKIEISITIVTTL